MASQVELFSKFSSFPDEQHVKDVCKIGQGEAACRFLVGVPAAGGLRYECAKATTLQWTLNERANNNDLRSRGNNCGGILEFISQNEGLLEGHAVRSEEDGEERDANFKSLNYDGKGFGVGGFGSTVDFTVVSVRPRGIIFSFPFLGQAEVLFEEPAGSRETPSRA
jgi:hypothetical protein